MIKHQCPACQAARVARHTPQHNASHNYGQIAGEEMGEDERPGDEQNAQVSGPLGGRTGAAGCGHNHSQLRGGVLFGDQVTDAVDLLGTYGGLTPDQIRMLEYRRSIGCPCLGVCTCGRLRRVPAANAGNMQVLNNQKAVCSCRRRWWG